MWPFMRDKLAVPQPEDCLPGRSQPMPLPERHFVNRHPLAEPYPEGMKKAIFGLGCFWGAERVFWQVPGVWVTMLMAPPIKASRSSCRTITAMRPSTPPNASEPRKGAAPQRCGP